MRRRRGGVLRFFFSVTGILVDTVVECYWNPLTIDVDLFVVQLEPFFFMTCNHASWLIDTPCSERVKPSVHLDRFPKMTCFCATNTHPSYPSYLLLCISQPNPSIKNPHRIKIYRLLSTGLLAPTLPLPFEMDAVEWYGMYVRIESNPAFFDLSYLHGTND